MADEIKAKIVIEADTSGADEATAALEKLQGMAGSFGEGGIGDAISAMSDNLAEGAKGAEGFTEALGGSEEALKANEEAAGGATAAMEEHQQAVESVGSAYEGAQEPVENMNKGLASIQETFTKSTPMVAQYAEKVQSVQAAMEEFNRANPWTDLSGGSFGPGDIVGETNWNAGEQLKPVSDAFSGITVSAEDAQNAVQGFFGPGWQSMSDAAPTAADAEKAVAEFFGTTEQGANDAGKALEKTGGIWGSIFGEGGMISGAGEGVGGFFGSLGEMFGSAMQGLNAIAMPLMAVQMLGQMGSSFGSWLYNTNLAAEGPNASNPASFTSQVDQLGKSIQDAGTSFATGFATGILPAINAQNNMNAQNPNSGSNFWHGAGQFFGGAAGAIGDIAEIAGGGPVGAVTGQEGLMNLWAQMNGQPLPYPGGSASPAGPGSPYLQAIGLRQQGYNVPFIPPPTSDIGADWSYFNSLPTDVSTTAIPTRYGLAYGGTVSQQDVNQQMGVQSPGFWGSLGETIGGILGNGNPATMRAGETVGNNIGSFFGGAGNFFGGLGQDFMKWWDPTGTLNNLGASGAGGSFGGCFIAGTRMLMANGSEKPIEQLEVGEKVLAHNGIDEVITTVLARITPPARVVYELKFSDGGRLTTTDSHPIATPLQGWKAISPINARRENPDLPISLLQIGDSICMFYGAVTLVSIEKKQIEQIYNITVDEPHTFYANNVLVHNKVALGGGGAQSIGDLSGGFQMPHIDMGAIASNLGSQFSGIQLPHLDLGGIASSLGGSFSGISLPHLDLGGLASSLGGSFSGIQLPHLDLGGLASSLGGAFSGIQLPHLDLGGLSSALGGAFSGITLPPMPNIGSMIQGALGGMFSGFSLPPMPDVGSMINGALSGMFSGFSLPPVPDIGGMINGALGGMFSGFSLPPMPDIGTMINGAISGIFSSVHMPSIPDFGAMINGAISGIFSSIHMPSIPGFASGVEGFSGGLAMVGEAGPELVTLPSGSSVYPLTSGAPIGGTSPSLSFGSGGGASPQTANISIYLGTQLLTQIMGMSLASDVHISTGNRAF